MRRAMLTVAVLALLGGCQTGSDPDLGHSVRSAVVAHAVDMTPRHAGVPIEGGEAVIGVAAQRRYLQGRVIRPVLIIGQGNGAQPAAAANPGRTSGGSSGGSSVPAPSGQ
ncbi:hypothetical protein GCM10007973_26000 [Polymorphobacter multimanifer]|uniref:Uncharacterized protein n=1 Tax=Polymorphobacter multimanifer TaxID=1070431 RepID=A0A841L2R9_9SPHN|nr:hypothetical protein [Polymorphobacter multimanifer]MBB6226596.1 hypothetical protein [Polymorphobacter multimanifer]GGI88447.1 hypothetical protein GCM10007973_26000 [Polymorphobacter multimanifer]